MKQKKRILILATFVILLLSSCASEATLVVTPTLTATSTFTPTFTPTNTITPTSTKVPTITPTPTPVSSCSPRATVQGEAKKYLPGFIDLINVSTSLTTISVTNKNYLVVIFTVRDIPETIKINQNHLEWNRFETYWGVAIDEDNDPKTGAGFIIGSKYVSGGYETLLSASSYKQGPEGVANIESFFANKVWVSEVHRGGRTGISRGTIEVDIDAKTITLRGSIDGITPQSYLYFFTMYEEEDGRKMDELCGR